MEQKAACLKVLLVYLFIRLFWISKMQTISCKFQEARDIKKDRELKNGLNLLK